MYELDKRVVRARQESSRNITFDESRMTLTVVIFDGDDERSVTFPAVYVVCDVCEGKGKHVDPAIDAHGITEDEYSTWSIDEQEAYFHGGYDIDCMTCKGRRVLAVINEDAIVNPVLIKELVAYNEQLRENDESESIARHERMMGA